MSKKIVVRFIRAGDGVDFIDTSEGGATGVRSATYMGKTEDGDMSFADDEENHVVSPEYCYEAGTYLHLRDDGWAILCEHVKMYNERTGRNVQLLDKLVLFGLPYVQVWQSQDN